MRRKQIILPLAIVLVATIVQLLMIRPGQAWGDDFAQYVQHARNLAEGRPYTDTGYLWNPHRALLAPEAYPPLFPALLSLSFRIRGDDLEAMKVVVVASFAGLLLAAWAYFRRRSGAVPAIGVLVLLATNARLGSFRDSLNPDLLFVALCYGALAAAESLLAADDRRARIGRSVLLGLCILAAFATRTVGLVLLPAIGAHAIWARRALPRATLLTLLAVVPLMLLQNHLLRGDNGYLEQIRFGELELAGNALVYAKALGEFWNLAGSPGPSRVVAATVAAAAGIGCLRRWRQGPRAVEFFLMFYAAAVLLFPATQRVRYLLPILPLVLDYFLSAAAGPARLRLLPVGLAILLLAVQIRTQFDPEFRSMDEGIHSPAARELFDWIRRETPPESRIIFRKPRALSLLTGRAAACYNARRFMDRRMGEYVDAIGADFVVVARLPGPEWREDLESLLPYLEAAPQRYRVVHSSPQFRIFRVLRP